MEAPLYDEIDIQHNVINMISFTKICKLKSLGKAIFSYNRPFEGLNISIENKS